MFIYPASDIHNEFSVFNFPKLENEAEITLVLPGDIFVMKKPRSGLEFITQVSARFKNVVIILGNHEFYHGSLLTVPDKVRNLVAQFPNVYFLHRESVVLDGVKFIGATLWTDFRQGDPLVKLVARDEMKDYDRIRTGTFSEPYKQRINGNHIWLENKLDRDFIEAELMAAKEIGQKCVVVTHHAPHTLSGKVRWETHAMAPLDYAYYNTGLEDLILDYGPVFWFHGHTHYKADYMIGDTRFVCNPRGYCEGDSNGYQNQSLVFDLDFILEL